MRCRVCRLCALLGRWAAGEEEKRRSLETASLGRVLLRLNAGMALKGPLTRLQPESMGHRTEQSAVLNERQNTFIRSIIRAKRSQADPGRICGALRRQEAESGMSTVRHSTGSPEIREARNRQRKAGPRVRFFGLCRTKRPGPGSHGWAVHTVSCGCR